MKYLFYLIFPLLIFAQDPSFHEPWKLEGASERIEKYRKTNTILNFNFPTDIKKKNGKLFMGRHAKNTKRETNQIRQLGCISKRTC